MTHIANPSPEQFMLHPNAWFPRILLVALVAAAIVIVLYLMLVLVARPPRMRRKKWSWWETLVYLATLLTISILGTTSFFTVLRYGGMHGWWLFAHMCGAGAFVGMLPLLALTWFRVNRFGAHADGAVNPMSEYGPRFFWLPKFTFWLIVIGGLAACVSMLLSMLPLFGTDTLRQLLAIHRYSGLLVVVAALLHFYSVLLQRAGLR